MQSPSKRRAVRPSPELRRGPASAAPSPHRPLFRERRRSPLLAFARAASWHRRKLAVLCAIAAVLCTVAAVTPSEGETVPVVVAARDLDGGRALTGNDLRIARYPLAIAPTDAVTDPAEITGRWLIAATGGGTPIGSRAVLAPRGMQAGVGRVLVPVRLADSAIIGLLRVGDVVDVLAGPADGGPARAVAVGARVMALPGGDAPSGPFGGMGGESDRLVILEASPTEANELVQAGARDRITVVLR